MSNIPEACTILFIVNAEIMCQYSIRRIIWKIYNVMLNSSSFLMLQIIKP